VASLIHSPGELSLSSNNDSLPDPRTLKCDYDDDMIGDECNKADLDSRLAEAARALNAAPSGDMDLAVRSEDMHATHLAEVNDEDQTKREQRRQVFTAKVSARW
jgi:hypothetical protein